MSDVVLQLQDIQRSYGTGGGRIDVLRGINLSLKRGELVALIAPSGAGKSTLLHCAGLLDKPDGGDVIVCGRSTRHMNDAEKTRLRCRTLGFIYQFHHLLPEFSALENVILPQALAGVAKSEARRRALDLLAVLGLSHRVHHHPATLSGGEQQRVAIARALANQPAVLLADEPTGNLDHHTAQQVFAALVERARGAGLAALVATHNPDLARQMDRQIHLSAA